MNADTPVKVESPNDRTLSTQPARNLFKSRIFSDFVKYEWLYSSIDRSIFHDVNDFQMVLKNNFCRLKTRRLTRAQWSCLRGIIGKPRRFSYAFLDEERKYLQGKRQQVAFIQGCLSDFPPSGAHAEQIQHILGNLPGLKSIPLRPTPGTAVCTRIESPIKGLYKANIQSLSNESLTYNVNLEKPVLINSCSNVDSIPFGFTQPVQECDVFVCSPSTVPFIPTDTLKSYLQNKSAPTNVPRESENSCDENIAPMNFKTDSQPQHILSNNTHPKDTIYEQGNRSSVQMCSVGFSGQSDVMSNFLLSLAQMHRILEKKQIAIAKIREMNDIAEAPGDVTESPVTTEFQQTYATLILHMDKLNHQLKHHIDVVLHHITEAPAPINVQECVPQLYIPQEYETVSAPIVRLYEEPEMITGYTQPPLEPRGVAADYGMPNLSFLTDWRRKCEDEAFDMVNRLKASQGPTMVDDSKFVLVAKLTSILTCLAHLQESRMTNTELSCIEEVFADIRQRLHPSNLKCFEQSVEQLISHIVLNLSPSILPMPQPNGNPNPSWDDQ